MRVPKFEQYYPTTDSMDKRQLKFYRQLEKGLRRGRRVDVDGNISYVFVFAYNLLDVWQQRGFEKVADQLIVLSELYSDEEKVPEYCRIWAYDCLLGQGRFEEYLEKTEPTSVIRTSTHPSNLRLNVERHIGQDADPLDIALVTGTRKSQILNEHEAAYRDALRVEFDGYREQSGDWFVLFDEWGLEEHRSERYLFAGAVISKNPTLAFEIASYHKSKKLSEISKALQREAENRVRSAAGLPRIGEGWVSETELFQRLRDEFSETHVIQHGQPHWLGRQHFDIWFPHWKIAVEYHGQQHFEPVEYFGGEEALEVNIERDQRKCRLARQNEVQLFVVSEGYDFESLVTRFRDARSLAIQHAMR